mmetsp:Transcript_97107/g.275094  ORF Transcript_97107/g.275094 Transcript_97107/m.275094 type:complete len:333 (-) Transcript_97107:142-1140(-)
MASQGRLLDRHGMGQASPSMETRSDARTAYGAASLASTEAHPSSVASAQSQPPDLDVTVLAFAQWVSEMKSRQHNSQHQMQAEVGMMRNAIASNRSDLADFRRHGAAIQQQMQNEIHEVRESLGGVFLEITNAVRSNAAADQDIKLKIQSLSEQTVRNETAFAQLADVADQSQSKLWKAVREMQSSSERMRDELGALTCHADNLESGMGDRELRIKSDMDQLTQEVQVQLERKREHLKRLVGEVMSVGEALQGLVADFGEQRQGAGDTHHRLQSSLRVLDQTLKIRSRSGAPRGTAPVQIAPVQQWSGSVAGQVTSIQPSGRPVLVANGVCR